jgi:hypothetical protein
MCETHCTSSHVESIEVFYIRKTASGTSTKMAISQRKISNIRFIIGFWGEQLEQWVSGLGQSEYSLLQLSIHNRLHLQFDLAMPLSQTQSTR